MELPLFTSVCLHSLKFIIIFFLSIQMMDTILSYRARMSNAELLASQREHFREAARQIQAMV